MPLGEYMQSVLKSNKSILKGKKNKFDQSFSAEKGTLDFSHLPKATPKQLNEIRSKIKIESKKRMILRLLLLVLTLIVFSLSVYFA